MAKRTYDQYCPVATSLDVLGERWTLLIVRELLGGARRYTDLRDALPGMWPNLLATRLKELEEHGVLARKDLPPPEARTVYELTEAGRDLEPVITALARWGLRRLPAPDPDADVPPTSAFRAAVLAWFRPDRADGVRETYGFEVGDRRWSVRIRDGRCSVRAGEPDDPAVTVRATPHALFEVRRGDVSLDDAARAATFVLEGDDDAVARFTALFDLNDVRTPAIPAPAS